MAVASGEPCVELLPGLVDAVASVARLELPESSDIFYYRNIPEYREISSECIGQAAGMLRAACAALSRPAAGGTAAAAAAAGGDDEDAEEALLEGVVGSLDDVLERLDAALDAAHASTEQFKLGGWAAAAQQPLRAAARGLGGAGAAAAGALARARVLRHVAGLPRPQDSFARPVDNSNRPWTPAGFAHLAGRLSAAATVAAAAAAAGGGAADRLAAHAASLAGASGASPSLAGAPHPYAAELASLRYQPWQLEAPEAPAGPPPPLEGTPFELVDTPEALRRMVAALAGERQVALDLEHHSYRSFLGFTCLVQVSTRAADWVVDALALREELGPALAAVLADPAIEKVLHGADSDVLWLQRDFGLYLVNLFDTGQAARALCYPSASLAHLMERHAGFRPDKRYQLADWRLRPLPADMTHYARCDTHFLLRCADALRAELAAAGARVPAALDVPVPPHSGAAQGALGVVLERSRAICCATYQKPLLGEASYLDAAARWGVALPPARMAVFAALFAWRDAVARATDESVSYVLPKAGLVELARAAPRSAEELRRLLGPESGGLGGGGGVALARAGEVLTAVAAGLAQAEGGAPGGQPQPQPQQAQAAAPQQQQRQQQQQQQEEGRGGPAPAAAAEVAPRELRALAPKALPALTRNARGSGRTARAAGGAAAAGAAGRGGPTPATGQGKPPPQEVPGAAQQGQEPQKQQQQQQQQQQQPEHTQQQQPEQQQQAEALPAAAAPPPAPRQLAPARKGGSSLGGLLASRPRGPQQQQQQQRRQQAAKAATLRSAFQLPFLAPASAAAGGGHAAADAAGAFTAAAGAPPAAAAAEGQEGGGAAEQQADHHQQQQQQAPAATTGADVRAFVDQAMAEAAGQPEPHGPGQPQEPGQGADTGGAAAGGAGEAAGPAEVLADLDYVPLSSRAKSGGGVGRRRGGNGGGGGGSSAPLQVPGDSWRSDGAGAVAGPPAGPPKPQKRKRGIFAAAASSDSDDSGSDDGAAAGTLPSYDPAALHRAAAPTADSERDRERPQAADGGRRGRGGGGGGGRGRGGRGGGRGSRGGSRHGGFMAAASASLAAVRQAQGGAVGGNLFAIPDENMMRGGKRRAVAPRGGNRSASFK